MVALVTPERAQRAIPHHIAPLILLAVVVPAPSCYYDSAQSPTPHENATTAPTSTTGDADSNDTAADDTAGRCGDGVIDTDEDCDPPGKLALGCNELLGYDLGPGGSVECTDTCEYNTVLCSKCGNGILDPGEDCDPEVPIAQDCESLGENFGPGGNVQCYPYNPDDDPADCTFNTTGCTTCGNGALDVGEDCDLTPKGVVFSDEYLNLMTGDYEPCAPNCGEGTCTSDCTIDQCHECACGNGFLDPEIGEECDCDKWGNCDLSGQTCDSVLSRSTKPGLEGLSGWVGDLTCNGKCQFDPSDCCLAFGRPCNNNDGFCCTQYCDSADLCNAPPPP